MREIARFIWMLLAALAVSIIISQTCFSQGHSPFTDCQYQQTVGTFHGKSYLLFSCSYEFESGVRSDVTK